MASSVGLPEALVIGAGAGSSQFVGVNCELIPNLRVSADTSQQVNRSYGVRIDVSGSVCVVCYGAVSSVDVRLTCSCCSTRPPQGASYELFDYRSTECGPLANVLVTEGRPGEVGLLLSL